MQVKTSSLLEHFASLEDPRIERCKAHLLLDIIAIAICAVIAGAETWVDMEDYGNAKQEWLSSYLSLNNGIPSHDTFARVFARLNPQQMQTCFVSWIKAVAKVTQGQVIAIDGKTIRGSYDHSTGKGAIHMVSAWASANRLVLGQVKVDERSNEITAIPELLQVLDIAGCIVTIDAMGCQTKIAKLISERGADYILSLKGNQGNLYEDVQQVFAHAQQQNFNEIDHSFYQSVDKNHGRIEIRRHWTMSDIEYLLNSNKWQNFKSIGMVQSERRVKGKTSIENRFYISSLPSDAELFAHSVRSHWQIENSQHWVLDVAFNEDDCRIRKHNAPENFAILRRLALNLLSQERSAKVGVKAKRLKAGWDNDYLIKVLGAQF